MDVEQEHFWHVINDTYNISVLKCVFFDLI